MAVARFVTSAFVAAILVSYIDAKMQWKDCGSVGGTVTNVIVEGCQQSTFACSLSKGKNASFSIEFTSKQDTTKLASVVHGVIASIPVPFPLDNPDACKDSNIDCPVKSGQTYKYHSSIFVKDEYPKISLAVRWELQDEHGADIACILLPAKIV